jgi:hypothetical protein
METPALENQWGVATLKQKENQQHFGIVFFFLTQLGVEKKKFFFFYVAFLQGETKCRVRSGRLMALR